MKKFSLSAVALLLSALFVFSAFTPVARAEGETDNFSSNYVTGAVLAVKDSGGEWIDVSPDSGNIPASADVRIHYTFSIPDTDTDIEGGNASIKAGTVRYLQLPSDFAVTSSIPSTPIQVDGQTVANFTANTSGLITITFTDKVAGGIDQGWLEVTSNLKKEIQDAGGEHTIDFQTNAGVINYKIIVDKDEPAPVQTSIVKSGKLVNGNAINWTITVDKENASLQNVVVTDAIPTGTTLVGTSVHVDGKAPADGVYSLSEPDMTFTLGNISKQTVITYQTTVDVATFDSTEGGKVAVSNTADMDYAVNNVPAATLSSTATVDVTTDWIKKSGSADAANNRILWTITVNNNNRTIPAGTDLVVTDTLPEGLTLDTSSVKLGSAAVSPGSSGEAGKFTYDAASRMFTYTFDTTGEITNVKTITFYTNVLPNDTTATQTFKNSATLTDDGTDYNSGEIGVGIGRSLINKSGSYDSRSHTITWTILVNRNGTTLNNAIVTDTISSDPNQEFVAGSVKLNGNPISESSYTYDAGGKLLTFTLGNIAAKQVITFQTTVTDKNDYATNQGGKNYNNLAHLVYDESSSNLDASATVKVTSQVLQKSFVSYNYTTRELTWKIIANQNRMPMQGGVITDVIGADQKFVKIVSVREENENGSWPAASLPAAADWNYNAGSKTLTYHLPNPLNHQYEIIFTTEFTALDKFQENKDVANVSNTAALQVTESGIPQVVSTAGTTLKNTVINKTGTQVSGANYINWTVQINSNSLNLSNIVIEDHLQEGLTLDTDSIKLYKMNVNSATGALTKGDLAAASMYSIGYANDLFSIKFLKPLDGPYQLEFGTDVELTQSGTISNTANFKGTATVQNSDPVELSYRYYSAAGGGTRGSQVWVTKTDAGDASLKLSGAIFELFDQNKNPMNPVRTATTDESGLAKFKGLTAGTYFAREITAPTGYQLNNSYFTVTVGGEQPVIGNLTITNTKKPTGGGGNPGGGTSSSEVNSVASSTSSITSSTSSVPNENIGDGSGPLAGASSKPNENIGDDNVGKAGGNPKTGESNTYLPIIISLMLAAAIVLMLGTYRSRRSKKVS